MSDLNNRNAQLELSIREQELRLKENDLKIREAELANKQQEVNQALAASKPKNWPWIYPVVRHDIKEDIPPALQKTCLNMFHGWKASVFVLLVNLIATLTVLLAHADGVSTATIDFGGSTNFYVESDSYYCYN